MEMHASRLTYRQTNSFGKIALDYVEQAEALREFYSFLPDLDGIKCAINARKNFITNRKVLQEVLSADYAEIELTPTQQENLKALAYDYCFTITTAHQPNLFTGPLYSLHKIFHVIRVAEYLNERLPENIFVPVYYIGSEDADLQEIGHFYLGDEKIVWDTDQSGAVGRMKCTGLEKIFDRLQNQFVNEPFGPEILEVIRNAYREENTIARANFELLNYLFAKYGLLVLNADNPKLKKVYSPVIHKELDESFSEPLLRLTSAKLAEDYRVQTEGRPVNLFYLFDDGRRERIEKNNNGFNIVNADVFFTKEQILDELEDHPERFSPNVVLRPAYQETILPNILFAGGGGELGYWLQLKAVFTKLGIPYPVLLLRNSFLMINEKNSRHLARAGLQTEELFMPETELLNSKIPKEEWERTDLSEYLIRQRDFYRKLQVIAAETDQSLQNHVAAMHTRALKELNNLDKKIKRAMRRNLGEKKDHVVALKRALFPHQQLQERIENFIPWFAKYGHTLLEALHDNSPALEQEFTVLEIRSSRFMERR